MLPQKWKSHAPSNFPRLIIVIQIPEEMVARVSSRLPFPLSSQAPSVAGETCCESWYRMNIKNFFQFTFLYLFIEFRGNDIQKVFKSLKSKYFQQTPTQQMSPYLLQDAPWSCYLVPAVLAYPGHPHHHSLKDQNYPWQATPSKSGAGRNHPGWTARNCVLTWPTPRIQFGIFGLLPYTASELVQSMATLPLVQAVSPTTWSPWERCLVGPPPSQLPTTPAARLYTWPGNHPMH